MAKPVCWWQIGKCVGEIVSAVLVRIQYISVYVQHKVKIVVIVTSEKWHCEFESRLGHLSCAYQNSQQTQSLLNMVKIPKIYWSQTDNEVNIKVDLQLDDMASHKDLLLSGYFVNFVKERLFWIFAANNRTVLIRVLLNAFFCSHFLHNSSIKCRSIK